jgi:hypothetical protein
MSNSKLTPICIAALIVVCTSLIVSCVPIQTVPDTGYSQSPPQRPPQGEYSKPVIDQRALFRQNMGKDLRDVAYNFQGQGLYKEAVIKYRESLAWWPDPALDGYIETLEKASGLPLSGKRRAWTEAPRVPTKMSEVIATIRNKSSREVYIHTVGGGESPETLFVPGEIREMAVMPNAYGEIVFSASRRGPLLATAKWVGDPSNSKAAPVVLYNDNNPEKIVVMTGFRTK